MRFLKVSLIAVCCLLHTLTFAATPVYKYVQIVTDKGTCVLRLYNETPKHRDNFVKLAKSKYYDGMLFHRVIQNFMIQGGDPDSKNAVGGAQLGNGGPGYTIPAEIQDGLFHKKGTIGAARDNNPAKASSGSQFYLVQGKVFTAEDLDRLEKTRMNGKKFSDLQRQAYTTIGGTPHLDWNYTVFGELVKGVDIIDQIAAVKTDKHDRPEVDQKMSMHVLTRREALNLERELQGLKPKTGFFTKIGDLFSSKDY
ncbi:peptidylprolyl isomerase [Sphingobacterium thalpophilum]|uniref:Peptidyl-prolyl cis-trans isomerase n=1 Tax=Sphingobacterium thalpophilum TaxID=259 RepID=A0A4V6KQN0_9SPHI|nr:peptidylprolyl isomerase [Sphingobacterium thalpophilum]VTR37868.1 Putative bifunctional phosphatase/peptidyl-prolyl cis-trans isomerase [Sphingobacterium thalpophilum]